MKIAITALGDSVKSKMDNRFGRCSFFAIYDTDLQKTDFLSNPGKENEEGAGPASVQFIASQGVERIISGEFGGKVKNILNELNIQMVIHGQSDITIEAILKQISSN
ncbi:NifB/NifX family molybdenum-iron cluster-binding protein [Mangrovibacterium sp.]|uniref:NifB/NifX family molybdenum-iron cluster-binding protein n=1 Tax=Mangrovibacterium sp. TaxID=1961364 RepID=UPI003568AAC7